jgi:hypothetical protein
MINFEKKTGLVHFGRFFNLVTLAEVKRRTSTDRAKLFLYFPFFLSGTVMMYLCATCSGGE